MDSTYRPVTMAVPSAIDNGNVRRGSFTSPAVKQMLFHASEEKRDPVCAMPIATKSPNAVTAVRPGASST